MKPKDECGIAACYALKDGVPDHSRDISSYIPLLLQDMQNRGELSAGISTYNVQRNMLLQRYRNLGTVKEVFSVNMHNKGELDNVMQGSCAIGHVRYATSGADDVNYAQPFVRTHGRLYKWFSFCFNGNLSNHKKLRKFLEEQKSYHINLDSDTEILMHLISREIAFGDTGDRKICYKKIFNTISTQVDGAYSLAFIDGQGRLIVVRDPLGFKPLNYVIEDDIVLVASESVALWNRGYNNIKSLDPGCLMIVDKNGVKIERYADSTKKSHCFFEWVYFSNVGSSIESKSIYEARMKAGEYLASIETLVPDEDTIVVAVPDTARASGDALGYKLKLPVLEGVIRNRYVGRSFIKSKDRSDIVSQKFTPLPSILKDKKVILVEDSLVRGTTLKHIIKDMKVRGMAKEIHLRIACPPILSPCFYGIDMSTMDELFAKSYIELDDTCSDLKPAILDKMAKDLGADSLLYLPLEVMGDVIGVDEKDLCVACVNSKYPTKNGRELYIKSKELIKQGSSSRIYD